MTDEKQENTVEQTKQNMAKVYGIRLTDIEEVILPNGKEYFKFYNPDDQTIKMIENLHDSKNLNEQFTEFQKSISTSQSENERQNARAVFDYHLKFYNIELPLISVRELKGNKSAYKYQFDALDPKKKKAIRILIENMDYLDLQYINLEEAVGIDKDNNVIVATYNPLTDQCELSAAERRSYDQGQVSITASDEYYTFDIRDEEFDELANIVDDENEKTNDTRPVAIRNHAINVAFAKQAYQYPEIIERSELSDFEKMLYRGLIAAISRKRQKAQGLNKNKQYVLTPKKPNQAAFVDSVLLALLLGFSSGLLMTLIYMTFKTGL